jgi:hypothetical protein
MILRRLLVEASPKKRYKMKKQIISSILISCILIQIPLTHFGCTSFYPTEDNNLSKYHNYEGNLLLKMKDATELRITPMNSFCVKSESEFIYGIGKEYNFKSKESSDFAGIIEKNKIDSSKLIENQSTPYRIYWLHDNRKIICEKEIFCTAPGFWSVLDNNMHEFRKIYDCEIETIEIQETNWLKTSALIVLGTALVLFVVAFLYVQSGGLNIGGGWE